MSRCDPVKQPLTFKVSFSDQRTVTVKAYAIEYHHAHVEFKDYYGTTAVAYRSEDVLTIVQVDPA